jgi:hypothetical protein
VAITDTEREHARMHVPLSSWGFGAAPAIKALVSRSGTKHGTTLITAPANISLLNDVFAWFIVPLIAVGPSRSSKIVKTSSKH